MRQTVAPSRQTQMVLCSPRLPLFVDADVPDEGDAEGELEEEGQHENEHELARLWLPEPRRLAALSGHRDEITALVLTPVRAREAERTLRVLRMRPANALPPCSEVHAAGATPCSATMH